MFFLKFKNEHSESADFRQGKSGLQTQITSNI